MIRVISYGKSMYGGWYVSYLEKQDNDYKGKHYKTLKALKDDMKKNNVHFSDYKQYRYDNI